MAYQKIFLPNYVTSEYRKLLKLSRHVTQPVDIKQIRLAFVIANEACKKYYQKLHEPLILQALQVAQIVVADIGLGTQFYYLCLAF